MKVSTPTLRILWIPSLVAVTIVVEVIILPTNPPLSPGPHYAYKFFKLLLFVGVGYLAPLAFWRFNALTRGIMLPSFRQCASKHSRALSVAATVSTGMRCS